MPDLSPASSPPPLPGAHPSPPPPEQEQGRLPTLIAWLITIASTVFMALSANYPTLLLGSPQKDEAALVESSSANAANELALLKIQSRVFIGFSEYPGVAEATGQLEDIATTPRAKIAIATVQAFIEPNEDGLEKANKLLDKIDDEENAELVAQVREALQNGIEENSRAPLEKQLGWFASLIRSKDADDTFGDEIRATSKRTAFSMMGAGAVGLTAFLLGIVFFVIFLILLSQNRFQFNYSKSELPSPTRKHLFLEAFAIYMLFMALGHVFAVIFHPYFAIAGYAVSFLLALFWPKIRGISWKETRAMIGWKRGNGFFKEVGSGIVGYLCMLVFLFVGVVIMLICAVIAAALQGDPSMAQPGSGTQGSHPIVGMLDQADSFVGKLKLFLLAAVMAPLLEETMFRGALHRFMRHRWGFFLSALVGGIIFAVVHPQGWIAVPALTAMGMGFSLLREWRNSLIASMTAHAIHNGAIVCMILLLIG